MSTDMNELLTGEQLAALKEARADYRANHATDSGKRAAEERFADLLWAHGPELLAAAERDAERGSVSRSTPEGESAAGHSPALRAGEEAAGHSPALRELRAENERLRHTLAWYAAPHRPEDYLNDNGYRAGQALRPDAQMLVAHNESTNTAEIRKPD